jgi:hypothetical protein
MAKSKIITLDFVEHDTIAALQYLIGAAKNNQVAGMVFAVSMKHGRGQPLFGATGRSATNTVEAAGMASMLHCQLTRYAIEAMK